MREQSFGEECTQEVEVLLVLIVSHDTDISTHALWHQQPGG